MDILELGVHSRKLLTLEQFKLGDKQRSNVDRAGEPSVAGEKGLSKEEVCPSTASGSRHVCQ